MYNLLNITTSKVVTSYLRFLSYVNQADRNILESVHDNAVKNGTAMDCEVRLILESGTKWVNIKAKAIKDNVSKKVTCLIGTILDITEQKKSAEHLTTLNAELVESARLAGMAE